MSKLELAGWLALLLTGFLGSALCSGMETGVYRLNRVRLYVRSRSGQRNATMLDRMIHRPAALLGTLLIGNNLTNYLGTAAMGVLLSQQDFSSWQLIVINTLLVSMVLFIFAETLPKDLFGAHADRLLYPLAPLLFAMRWFFTATLVLPVVVVISRFAVRLTGGSTLQGRSAKWRIAELVRYGAGYGVLSDEQSAMAQRALEIFSRPVSQEATPWPQVKTLSVKGNVSDLVRLAKQTEHSRFPVLDDSGAVVGTIDLIDALAGELSGSTPIEEVMSETVTLSHQKTVRQALKKMQQAHVGLLTIVRENQRPTGIVTAKDLVETLTGDIRHW